MHLYLAPFALLSLQAIAGPSLTPPFSASSHLLRDFLFLVFSAVFLTGCPGALFIGRPSGGVSGFIFSLLIFLKWQIFFLLHFSGVHTSVATTILLLLSLSIPLSAGKLLLKVSLWRQTFPFADAAWNALVWQASATQLLLCRTVWSRHFSSPHHSHTRMPWQEAFAALLLWW